MLDDVIQRATLYEFHYIKEFAVLFTKAVNLDDIWMV